VADLSTGAVDALLHMLGLGEKHHTPWRNHYVTSGADSDIDELVAAGLAEEVRRPGFLARDARVFAATEKGRDVARVERARRYPRPTRNRARYLHWLDCADANSDLTFGDYLRQRLYRQDGR
jgi:hypothetical protein